MTSSTASYHSPIGWLNLTEQSGCIVSLDLIPDEPKASGFVSPLLENAIQQLHEYFAGQRFAFDLPFAPKGTLFQESVWACLQIIGYGETASYKQIAELVGKPKAFRAVGTANGRNPLPILIPCHRIIAADGTLGGYAYGLETKQFLLNMESRFKQ